MRFIIKHEIKGRIRVHAVQRKMTMKEADILCYYLEQTPGVTKVKVYEQTGDATVEYQGGRKRFLTAFEHSPTMYRCRTVYWKVPDVH